ncbi:RluA family pseudouridine synthase [Candidatus Parcubacteria bacterium]|nr:RluA family pseudouridine synthase [Candidatus Parcubacteria bacterium]
MKPTVLYEDDNVLVIDKPAGLIVHPDGRNKEYSVTEWVVNKYPQTAEVGEPLVTPQGETIARPGIVHRLDKTTSGALILAKTQEAHAFLKEQFGSRTTEKTYAAYVYGHPKKDAGTIEKEIVRLRSMPPRWGVMREGEDKKHRAAITTWNVEIRGSDTKTNEPVSYMVLSPKTGRTHQLRVHMRYVGHPIICDPIYAAGKPCLLGFVRPALHASTLSITLPSGERKTFVAPPPADFLEAAERFAAD